MKDRIREMYKKKTMTPEDAVKDIAGLPLHDGAQRYYQEIGVL